MAMLNHQIFKSFGVISPFQLVALLTRIDNKISIADL